MAALTMKRLWVVHDSLHVPMLANIEIKPIFKRATISRLTPERVRERAQFWVNGSEYQAGDGIYMEGDTPIILFLVLELLTAYGEVTIVFYNWIADDITCYHLTSYDILYTHEQRRKDQLQGGQEEEG